MYVITAKVTSFLCTIIKWQLQSYKWLWRSKFSMEYALWLFQCQEKFPFKAFIWHLLKKIRKYPHPRYPYRRNEGK